jgi:HD-GYP domain-containing protein (c-di-GMP phosphodiesterase class II)
VDVDSRLILNLGELASRIIDYKSPFTRRHSTGIAEKAWIMGTHYEYDQSRLADSNGPPVSLPETLAKAASA